MVSTVGTAHGVIRFVGCASPERPYRRAIVSSGEELLRRLALNDERCVARVLANEPAPEIDGPLAPKIEALVRLAAMLAIGAATTSLRPLVQQNRGLGATEDEIVAVLVAIGPALGLAGLVGAAPRLAAAIGYDLNEE